MKDEMEVISARVRVRVRIRVRVRRLTLTLTQVMANRPLRKDGHNELMIEELIAGRLYTGPCYSKYNSVLRMN